MTTKAWQGIRWRGWVPWCLLLASGATVQAQPVPAVAPAAAEAAQPAAPAVPDAALALIRQAQSRMADADTLLSLTQEGAVLYAQDGLRMTGYQYCSQAVALAEAGEFRESLRAASKALYLAETTQDAELMARALRDLAIAFSYAGQLDKALEFANLALAQPVQDATQVQGPALKVVADVQARRGETAQAVATYRKALEQSSERYRPLVQASLTNALIDSGDTEAAAQTLAAIAAPPEPSLQAQLDRTQARLLLAQGQPERARNLYTELAQRNRGADAAYYRLWAWEGVAHSELQLGNSAAASAALAQAMQDADQVRARFRSEEFKMGLFSDVQGIFEQAVSLHVQAGDAEAAFDASERGRARALLDAVRERDGGAARWSALALADIQRALQPDERIVQFHALPDALQVWTIGPASVRLQQIAVSQQDLARVVEAFRDAITQGRASAIPAAEQLGALLLGPLELQPGWRLTVIPHGPLHYLPFQALRLEGQYLIERHPVAVAPSGSIAARLAGASGRTAPQLVAFGNPSISQEYDLPGAEQEVQRLAALYPNHQLFLGQAATRQAFLGAGARAPILHVAAHAQADLVDPLYSRILLASEDGQQRVLEAHEILEMELQGNALITLSACESGLGRVAQGDEVLGFTRSFLSAGSTTMIASLWPVSDDATAILMETLYMELGRGADVQRAMQAGQLAVLAQPRMAHPFFWAPFNLIGDWRLTLDGTFSTAQGDRPENLIR